MNTINKTTLLLGAAMINFLASHSSHAVPNYTSNVAGSDYTVGTNWQGGIAPTTGDTPLINVGRSTTVSSVVTDSPDTFTIQNTEGTATVNIVDGGSLSMSTSTIVGHQRTGAVADGFGVLNISGGTYGGGDMIVGNFGLAQGIVNVSGSGTLTFGDMVVDNTTNTKGTINVSGSSATISGTSMTLNENADLNFNLGSAGISTIALSGAFTLDSAADLVIDADLYTGGVGSFDLITFGSIVGSTWGSVDIINLDSSLTGAVMFDSDSMYLSLTAIPEPGSFALLAGCLGLGFVMMRRRRS